MSRWWRSAASAAPVVLLAVALAVAGCGGGEAPEEAAPEGEAAGGKQVKAAFVYVSPVGDAGWTLAHDNARKVIDELGYVETAYTEAVPEAR